MVANKQVQVDGCALAVENSAFLNSFAVTFAFYVCMYVRMQFARLF